MGIETPIVVSSLIPSLGSHQVVISQNTSLSSLAELRGKESLISLVGIFRLFKALIGLCLVDMETCQLLVKVILSSLRTLFIFTEQLTEMSCPFQGFLIMFRRITCY